MEHQARIFGLIGYPLSHSFSKKYFTAKFENEGLQNCRYELFPISDIQHFPALLEANPGLAGLNVTIPFKKSVMDYLGAIDAEASAAGAVNTIRIRAGKLEGFNTDIFGFEKSLSAFLGGLPLPAGLQALVLGTGGAAGAVAFVLKKLGIPFRRVSRLRGEGILTYPDLTREIIAAHRLIVNTTPLGMYPDTGTCPDLPYDALGPGHFVFDLVYNPETTLFLEKAKAEGALTSNGLQMLHLQADRAWEIWNANF